MSRPRLELRTFCVLDRCDNQLRHRPDGAMWRFFSMSVPLLGKENLDHDNGPISYDFGHPPQGFEAEY